MIRSRVRSAVRRKFFPFNRHATLGFRLAFRPFSNSAPFDLNSTGPLVIAENQPIGTIVGEFNATDPDGDVLTYHLASGAGDGNNSLFTLDQNGVLKSASVFNYESGANLFIRVVARDEHNASAEGNFTVFLTDLFEDLDGDGIEDHLDPDMDGDGINNSEDEDVNGDGFTNIEEAKYPADLLAIDLRLVHLTPSGPVALGYPDYPEINVTINDFLVGKHEVTFHTWSHVRQAAFEHLGWNLASGVQGNNGSANTNPLHPVTNVNFLEIALWCNALSLLIETEPYYLVEDGSGILRSFAPQYMSDAQLRGLRFSPLSTGIRVPNGNEWEYAARGGLTQKTYPWGNESANGKANYFVGTGQPNATTPVGTYPANGFGLTDMVGGVIELIWDDEPSPSAEVPQVLTNKIIRRGSGWNVGGSPKIVTAEEVNLLHANGSVGFRVARSTQNGLGHFVDLNSTVALEMIWVQPGTFTMGSPVTEAGRKTSELERNVTLTEGFYLGKYEVTQAQYEAVMAGNADGLSATPSQFGGSNRPVEQVSWNDVQVFLSRLNQSEQAAGRLQSGWEYALPTEAQWEYACRAGTKTAYHWGNDINASLANYVTSGIGQHSAVGQYPSNPWGLYDMHGNVWEWTTDWFGQYDGVEVSDPVGPVSGAFKVPRSGSAWSDGTRLRAAARGEPGSVPMGSDIGFRLAYKPISSSPPVDLNATSILTIAESQPIGTVVGAFTAVDPQGQNLSFALVSGTGDTDNANFTMDPNGVLKTAKIFDSLFDQETHSIRVRVTNTSGKSTEGVFQVTLLPSQEDNPIEIIASSTRAEIGPGDGQLVIGVLVSGGTVDMMVKGLGPSLPVFGALPDPVLTVFSAQGGAIVEQSDDWQSHASSAEVSALGHAPASAKESALGGLPRTWCVHRDFIRHKFAGGNRCASYRKYPASQGG